MVRFCISILFCAFSLALSGQPLNGTTGLLNVPSAEMQRDGTFFAGANCLPDALTPGTFDYDTGNYYFNITFLPFFEFNYRLTLMKVAEGNWNQDRSFGMRLRLLREREWLPAVVIGGNDLYSTSGKESGYFNALYAVATKNFNLGGSRLGVTAGYGHEGFGKLRQETMKGGFGGVTFLPAFAPSIRLVGEYDTRVLNAGLTTLLWRHLFLYGMLYDMKVPTGGFAVFLYL